MSAILSRCGTYRYRLGRTWDDTRYHVTFIMLNPSTADAEQDDPTIRRCIGFARAMGGGGITVVNLYAYRATKPADLWRVDASTRVGPENDHHLSLVARAAKFADNPIVAAWGAGAPDERVAEVLSIPGMDRLLALGVTKTGAPRHPLYLRADAQPFRWPVSEGVPS